MSFIVKGMEMPKNCKKCMFADFDDVEFDYELYCAVSKKYADLDARDRPLGWACPLTEVKEPHGRLIDADKLARETIYNPSSAPYITEQMLLDAPTVIEAEGSKDEHR